MIGRTFAPRFLRIRDQRAEQFDAVAGAHGRVGLGPLTMDRVRQRRFEEPKAGHDARRGDGIGDAGALADVYVDQNGPLKSHVSDLHVHLACSFSARRTNASMNVFAIWLNTGPTIASIKWVLNS